MIRDHLRTAVVWLVVSVIAPSGLHAADARVTVEREASALRQPVVENSAVQRTDLGQAGTTDADADWGDLGDQILLQRPEVFERFWAFADLSAFHTNNVALARRGAESDAYLVTQAGVGWRERLGSNGIWDFSVQEALFRYDQFTDFDFDSLNVGSGVSWNLRQLWSTLVFARYNYNRLNTGGYLDEKFYDTHTLRVGLQKAWQLSRADYLLAGGAAEVNFSDPAALQRNEYAVIAGYGIQLTRSVSADLLYRAALSDYTETDRIDLNQSVSVGGHYRPVAPVQLNAYATAGFNRSNHSVYDYNVLNVGAGVSLKVEF